MDPCLICPQFTKRSLSPALSLALAKTAVSANAGQQGCLKNSPNKFGTPDPQLVEVFFSFVMPWRGGGDFPEVEARESPAIHID